MVALEYFKNNLLTIEETLGNGKSRYLAKTFNLTPLCSSDAVEPLKHVDMYFTWFRWVDVCPYH